MRVPFPLFAKCRDAIMGRDYHQADIIAHFYALQQLYIDLAAKGFLKQNLAIPCGALAPCARFKDIHICKHRTGTKLKLQIY